MFFVRVEIEALSFSHGIFLFPDVDFHTSGNNVSELLALVGIVRYGGSPLLQGQPDGFHLVSLGVWDDPFDAALSGRIHYHKIIFLREHHHGAGPVGKEFSAFRPQTGENILQGGDTWRSQVPLHL